MEYQTGFKSLAEIAWDVTEPEYRADKAYSYSKISRFSREGWRKLRTIDDQIESSALRFGSIVDTLLTDTDNFDKLYEIFDIALLSDKLIRITGRLHRKCSSTCSTIYDIPAKDILEELDIEGYQSNWKPETRVRVAREACSVYYEALFVSTDAQIISQADFDDAQKVVHKLKTNPTTKYYFNTDQNPALEKLFQLKFKAEWGGIEVRCMFDEIIVDHINKVIYPIDLKTTGHPEEDFEESFWHWGYYIQAQLYTYILYYTIQKDNYFREFTIMPYEFIVINRRSLSPIVWKFKDSTYVLSSFIVGLEKKLNWSVILTKLVWHINHPYSEYPFDNSEGKGIISNYKIEEDV